MKESDRRSLKVALAGCGRIAFLLEQDPLRYKPCTHLGALRYWAGRDKRVLPVAFCDPDRARAQAARQFLSVPHAVVTDRFAELLLTKPELLIIAASTAAHFDLLAKALKAGVPRIVVEKPVTFSAQEAGKLRQMVLQSDSVILPNYERRYHPKYLRLKKSIAVAGKAATYRGFFSAGGKGLYADKKGDEGVLLHDTTHLLDLAQYLFGPVQKHTVVAGKKCHVLHLEHAGGAVGLIETHLGIGVFHLELEVRLADRRVTVGNGYETTEKIAASRHYRSLKAYNAPQRSADAAFAVSKNPFVQLYREALYGTPDNAHLFEALENVLLLSYAQDRLSRPRP